MRGYVPIFFDWLECTQDLTQEEKGNLIDAVMLYATGEEYEQVLTGNERIAFRFMRGQLDRNAEISETRARAGARNKREQTETNANKPEQTDNKNEQKEANANKQKQKEAKQAAELRFDRFWAAYPKKNAKPSAKKAFEKLKPDDALVETMLDAIQKQAQSAQWQENGGQYIPYPATWLNGRRWEDEAKPAGPQLRTVGAQNYEQREYTDERETPEDMVARLRNEMLMTGG